MTRVLEIHLEEKLPEISEDDIEGVKEILENYPDAELKQIMVSDEGIAIEEWKAPDAETVEKILEDLMGPDHCDAVVEVEKIEI